jgi:hypothetical protein
MDMVMLLLLLLAVFDSVTHVVPYSEDNFGFRVRILWKMWQ